MTYVDSQLLPGEVVRHRARLHKIIFAWSYAFAIMAVVLAVAAVSRAALHDLRWVALFCLVVSAAWYAGVQILNRSSEFAVTNKRVVIKVGWMQRRTLETMLSKIEGIAVDQSMTGRMLNYGSIVVTGTGGTKERFERIANPLEFRRQVQAAISAAEDARAGIAPPTSVNPANAAQDRQERDCPFCAERILVQAKVCKHCGRAVPAAESGG